MPAQKNGGDFYYYERYRKESISCLQSAFGWIFDDVGFSLDGSKRERKIQWEECILFYGIKEHS